MVVVVVVVVGVVVVVAVVVVVVVVDVALVVVVAVVVEDVAVVVDVVTVVVEPHVPQRAGQLHDIIGACRPAWQSVATTWWHCGTSNAPWHERRAVVWVAVGSAMDVLGTAVAVFVVATGIVVVVVEVLGHVRQSALHCSLTSSPNVLGASQSCAARVVHGLTSARP